MTQAQIEKRQQLLEVQKYYQLSIFVFVFKPSQYSALKQVMDDLERELSQTSSLNDNVIVEMQPPPLPPKKKIRRNRKSNYSSMKVKARNLLTNVSYNRVKVEDFNNKLFVVHCYTFLLLYLNPFYLERKFDLPLDRNYVEKLWYSVIPGDFYMFICRPDNYARLNKIKLRFQDTIKIVRCFTDD